MEMKYYCNNSDMTRTQAYVGVHLTTVLIGISV